MNSLPAAVSRLKKLVVVIIQIPVFESQKWFFNPVLSANQTINSQFMPIFIYSDQISWMTLSPFYSRKRFLCSAFFTFVHCPLKSNVKNKGLEYEHFKGKKQTSARVEN